MLYTGIMCLLVDYCLDVLDSNLSSVFSIHGEDVSFCDLEVGSEYIVFFSKSYIKTMQACGFDLFDKPARIYVRKNAIGEHGRAILVTCYFSSTPMWGTSRILHSRMVNRIIRIQP